MIQSSDSCGSLFDTEPDGVTICGSILPSRLDGVVLTDRFVPVGGLEESADPVSGRSPSIGTAFLGVDGDGLGRRGELGSTLGDCGGERGAEPSPDPLRP